MRKPLGGDGYIHCLDFADSLMVHMFVKTYQIVYFKYVLGFFVCQLYFKKAIFKTTQKIPYLSPKIQLRLSILRISNMTDISHLDSHNFQ